MCVRSLLLVKKLLCDRSLLWQCRGDSPPIAHLAGTGTHSTGMVHARARSAGHLRHCKRYGVGRCGCSQRPRAATRATRQNSASWHSVWQPQRPAAPLGKSGSPCYPSGASPVALIPCDPRTLIQSARMHPVPSARRICAGRRPVLTAAFHRAQRE